MNIEIIPKDVLLTPADETYIRNRLYFGLAADQQGLDSAVISICAIPGFESEGMQHCRVEIQLANGCTVIGDSSESNIYIAIDRAVERSYSKLKSSTKPAWLAFRNAGTAPYEVTA